MTDLEDRNDGWQSEMLSAVSNFGDSLADLHRRNPWQDRPLLEQAINYLMTELWDHGFSQTEIREAFNAAVADMPRYAAGDERRS